jgi:magnesium transporter
MTEDLASKTRQIIYRPKDRLTLFRECTLPEQSIVMAAVSPYVQQDLLKALTIDEIVNVLDHMDLRAAKRVVEQVKDIKFRTKITNRLKTEIKEKVEYFLRFHPKATMSLVHFSYILVSHEEVIGEVANSIEEHHKETGKFPEVLVHKNGVLEGEVTLATLVRERNSAKIKTFIKPVATISYRAEVQEIIEAFTQSSDKKLVVLDEDESVLGIIYADDALALFGKLPAETLYSVSGLDQGELPHDSVSKKFHNRYRWLILNLLTCFMAASVIVLFEDTIDKLALLAVFIPIVAGMGSNVGAQAFAVTLRGLIMGTVNLQNGWPAIRNEIITAAITGTLIGGIVTAISLLLYGSVLLGVVVTLSLIGVHMVGGMFGALIPLILKRYGIDPAGVTNILLTTATDILGLFLLLGLGTLLLM